MESGSTLRATREAGASLFSSSELVPRFQNFSRSFTDDHARGHRIAGGYARHDRAIRNAKVGDSVHFEVAIYNRHAITTNPGSAGLVMICNGCIANELFKGSALQVAWHYLALDKGPKGG